MAKTIAFVNQKGGVGKTTSRVNLAACLQEAGAKVLVCDFDPQGNATSGFGVDKGAVFPTIYDVLISGAAVEHAIVHTKYSDVSPANKGLAGASVEMIPLDRREYRLKDALAQVEASYDFILIDCPPPWNCSPSTACARRIPCWCRSSANTMPWKASATCCPPSAS